MSKRDLRWPAVGSRVEVEFVATSTRDHADSWNEWTFHGARGGWVCLMPVVGRGARHEGEGRLHWFPASVVACIVEVDGE